MRLAAKIIASMGSVTLGLILLSTPASAACLAEGAGCGNTSTPCCEGLVCALDSATIKHCVSGGTPATTTTTTTRPAGTTTTTVPPGSDPNAGVFEPTYADVSIRYPDPQLFFRGYQLDQAGRDKMVEQQSDYMSEAIVAARAIGCTQQANFCIGSNMLNGILTRFGCCGPYDNIIHGQLWEITEQGADNLYDVPRACLAAIRNCAVGNKKTACAASPYFHAGMQDLLDIRKQNGACVLGGTFADVPHPAYAQGGPGDDNTGIARDINVGKPDAEALAKLDALMESHHQDVAFKCGTGGPPVIGVHGAMTAFQSTPYCMANADRRHFCQMKQFNGVPDPSLTPGEFCQRAKLTHHFMTAWGDAIRTGQWGLVRQMDTAHKSAHRCVNLKSPNYRIIFPCGDPQNRIDVCPKLTCEQAVAKFVP